MKRFLVLWLLMASCLPVSVLSQGTCANKNHMLSKLAGAGVAIYRAPKPNNLFCKEEWASAGTCCEPSEAGSAMKRKTDKNLKEVQELIKEIESLPTVLQSFHLGVVSAPLMAVTIKLLIQQKYDKLTKYIASQRKVMVSSHSLCINKLNTITRASTCNICSGRSQLFFKGKKLMMKEEDCRLIIGDCEEAWRGVVDTLNHLEDYMNEVKKTYTGELNKDHFDSLQALKTSHKLTEHFQKCPNFKECSVNVVADICEQMVSILTPSYAEKVVKTLDKTVKAQPRKFRHVVGQLFLNVGKAVIDGVKHIGAKIGSLFNRGSRPSSGKQQKRQNWALSSRHRPRKSRSRRNRLLRTGNGSVPYSVASRCDGNILASCGTDILVSRVTCPACPDFKGTSLP